MPKIKLYCNTGYPECGHDDILEVDDAEWAAMSETEQEEFLEQAAQTHLGNHIDYGAYVEE